MEETERPLGLKDTDRRIKVFKNQSCRELRNQRRSSEEAINSAGLQEVEFLRVISLHHHIQCRLTQLEAEKKIESKTTDESDTISIDLDLFISNVLKVT